MVSPVFAILLASTSSIAAPYHFPTGTVPVSEMDAVTVTQLPAAHSPVLAAAFGFQAAGSSAITVRTYDAPTGAILSEDSFDVNVKEEGVAEHDENKGRIFAGGIGTDSEGKSKFMLRVYDAETGRFLWEGQLNLLKLGEGGMTRAGAALIPNSPAIVQTSAAVHEPLQTLFSVRAVNPVTGGLVWQDQFAPGNRKRAKGEGVLFDVPRARPIHEPIGHIFDLVVRTYDRMSGTLLWEDSFEQLDRIEEPASDPGINAYPQAIPSWSPIGVEGADTYRTALR
ncbi:MAG: PQQ-binding-like beta-propeller repeat protein [Nitrospira defluvii]|nr:PQQ-binding-like beta-propeller repeat protein [Nitrospira defluvii]